MANLSSVLILTLSGTNSAAATSCLWFCWKLVVHMLCICFLITYSLRCLGHCHYYCWSHHLEEMVHAGHTIRTLPKYAWTILTLRLWLDGQVEGMRWIAQHMSNMSQTWVLLTSRWKRVPNWLANLGSFILVPCRETYAMHESGISRTYAIVSQAVAQVSRRPPRGPQLCISWTYAKIYMANTRYKANIPRLMHISCFAPSSWKHKALDCTR